jgi:hypothetical protein
MMIQNTPITMGNKMKNTIYLLILSFLAIGCQVPENPNKIEVKNQTVTAEKVNKRFSAEFHGEFSGGYNNNIRSIFIIKDNQTKKEYLAITGCGTTELNDKYDDNLKITITEEE